MSIPRPQPDPASERGAVVVFVAVALVGLIGVSTFVVDYGVMWAARRQAQNSADAAALAGAISLAYVDFENHDLARQSALAVAAQNKVWGEAPDITAADITFPVCPPGSPGAGTNSCIRVNVFRNQRVGGKPLPTIFGKLVGINDQSVQATATAEALFGNSTDCVKPMAVADKWTEKRPVAKGWDENDTFERYGKKGVLLDPADVYEGGFTPKSLADGGDYGRYITLKHGDPHDTLTPGWFQPVVINAAEGPGGANYRENIAKCDPTVIGPGAVLDVEPGNMIGPTKQGMDDLIALDSGAKWNQKLNDGAGGIEGGCMSSIDNPCAISPRLVAIPMFNPDTYQLADQSGRTTIQITKVLGFFVDRMDGDDVKGYLMTYPADPTAGMGGVPGSGFVVSVALVR